MSRQRLPYHAPDISALARSLARQLDDSPERPGHVELLNLLARAVGFRNYQALRASHQAETRLARGVEPETVVDFRRVEQWRCYFDDAGCLQRWPKKHSHREACLWVLWSRLPARQRWSERELNERLRPQECLGDHLLLRRALVDGGWLARTDDGGEYWRIERRPPAELSALLSVLPSVARLQA
ncbi:DUF2087 domain-containing protein [Pseudomonas nitroreducens]|uniref:DUF2087 domain-containing protein n=1 Tax=Pseudomonas nitroreducens TaxID=46680 RepID=UPI00031C5FF9|nr:DUF2087 domain-containing protein [Pseudomonas nitroreducens]